MGIRVKAEASKDLSGRMVMGSESVQQALDISKSTLRRLVRREISSALPFPLPVKGLTGTRVNGWLRSDIEAWLEQRLAATRGVTK
jgi:predicted DNA-binding transcriptional regulator AlpA